MRRQLLLSIYLMLVTYTAPVVNATTGPPQSPRPFFSNDNNCESNKSLWDSVAIDANDDLIILIARAGDGEAARRVNRRRLHNIYTYLTYIRGIPKERVVKAEGERVSGRGRIDVYLRGEMHMVFTVGRNEDLAGGECELPTSPLYYPMEKRRR